MKILLVIAALLLLLLAGGFAFFAFTDVPIPQTEVSKEIPNERLNAQ